MTESEDRQELCLVAEGNKMNTLGGVKARNRRMPNGTYGGVGDRET
ncbi:MAG: hypothetical protein PUC31_01150 [Bacteroidales bacterium]|nr:hypothetical protein [Bacteroidales bacterium]